MYGKDHRKEIGERIQKIRGSRDQRTFAENVNSVQQTISKYERGEIPQSWLFLARLADEENVDLNRLLNGSAGETHETPGNGGDAKGRSEEREESTYRASKAGANGEAVHA